MTCLRTPPFLREIETADVRTQRTVVEMNMTGRKGLDPGKVMYINWINEDFLIKFGLLKQKLDCLKFLAPYLCDSLLLLQDSECNSFIYFRFKLFDTEIQPLQRWNNSAT